MLRPMDIDAALLILGRVCGVAWDGLLPQIAAVQGCPAWAHRMLEARTCRLARAHAHVFARRAAKWACTADGQGEAGQRQVRLFVRAVEHCMGAIFRGLNEAGAVEGPVAAASALAELVRQDAVASVQVARRNHRSQGSTLARMVPSVLEVLLRGEPQTAVSRWPLPVAVRRSLAHASGAAVCALPWGDDEHVNAIALALCSASFAQLQLDLNEAAGEIGQAEGMARNLALGPEPLLAVFGCACGLTEAFKEFSLGDDDGMLPAPLSRCVVAGAEDLLPALDASLEAVGKHGRRRSMSRDEGSDPAQEQLVAALAEAVCSVVECLGRGASAAEVNGRMMMRERLGKVGHAFAQDPAMHGSLIKCAAALLESMVTTPSIDLGELGEIAASLAASALGPMGLAVPHGVHVLAVSHDGSPGSPLFLASRAFDRLPELAAGLVALCMAGLHAGVPARQHPSFGMRMALDIAIVGLGCLHRDVVDAALAFLEEALCDALGDEEEGESLALVDFFRGVPVEFVRGCLLCVLGPSPHQKVGRCANLLAMLGEALLRDGEEAEAGARAYAWIVDALRPFTVERPAGPEGDLWVTVELARAEVLARNAAASIAAGACAGKLSALKRRSGHGSLVRGKAMHRRRLNDTLKRFAEGQGP